MVAEMQAQMQAKVEAAAAAEAARRRPAPAPAGAMAYALGDSSAQPEIDPADPETWGKTGRNAPCPCGSGKKYKHCHGRLR
jgi:preprotein translocase subunit SecA